MNDPKVRITNKTRQAWYNVGEEYNVEEYDENFYVLPEDMKENAREFRVISKDDCEVIDD